MEDTVQQNVLNQGEGHMGAHCSISVDLTFFKVEI